MDWAWPRRVTWLVCTAALGACTPREVPSDPAPLPAPDAGQNWLASAADCTANLELALPRPEFDNRPTCSQGWVRTGALHYLRARPAAVVLQDGRVLLTGGWHANPLDVSEVWDPTTGQWTLAAPMNDIRAMHTATLLEDGRVLVAGGQAWCWNDNEWAHRAALTTAEVYDPRTDTWQRTGAMHQPRSLHAAVRLPDGRVLVAGGNSGFEESERTAEVWDPRTGTWTPTGPLTAMLRTPTAALTPAGVVLSGAEANAAMLYDAAHNSWSALPSRRGYRPGTLVALPSGRAVLAPSYLGIGAEAFDPDTRSWSAAGDQAFDRYRAPAVLLDTGEVLLAGGASGDWSQKPLSQAELYDPKRNAWRPAGHMAVRRDHHVLLALPGGRAMAVAGYTTEGSVSWAEIFDPAQLAADQDSGCPAP